MPFCARCFHHEYVSNAAGTAAMAAMTGAPTTPSAIAPAVAAPAAMPFRCDAARTSDLDWLMTQMLPPQPDETSRCPRCAGAAGWLLTLHAYAAPDARVRGVRFARAGRGARSDEVRARPVLRWKIGKVERLRHAVRRQHRLHGALRGGSRRAPVTATGRAPSRRIERRQAHFHRPRSSRRELRRCRERSRGRAPILPQRGRDCLVRSDQKSKCVRA